MRSRFIVFYLVMCLFLVSCAAGEATTPSPANPPIEAATPTATISPETNIIPDKNWTCDNGPDDVLNAAQEAQEEGDQKTAWWLAAHGEALCTANPERFSKAAELRRALERSMSNAPPDEPGDVDLGWGYLHMACVGEGSPTIIFENGGGQRAKMSWENIQPAMSTVTRACRYDRRGLGLSSSLPSGAMRTTQDQVNELVDLLKAAEIEPPYILVGHSYGGLNIALFTDQHPDMVAGLVFVSALHPQWPARAVQADPAFQLDLGGELIDAEASIAQVIDVKDFGDVPTAVLPGGDASSYEAAVREAFPYNEAAFNIFVELQKEYASYSTNSRFIPLTGGGHWPQNDRPDGVIEAILWVLNEARNNAGN